MPNASPFSRRHLLGWAGGLTAAAVLGAPLFAAGMLRRPAGPAPTAPIPAPLIDNPAAGRTSETIVLAGGCFWGIQGVFQHVKGVTAAVSGYAGGRAATAHYEVVGTGTTGHAESVQITFDPRQVTLGQLLRIFFTVGTDPTQVNQQFPDAGPQYRSVVFFSTPAQKRVAEAYIAQLNAAHVFAAPIATQVTANPGFYAAEAYHQNYLTLHPTQPYIATYDLPKVEALKRMFPAFYRAQPVLVRAP
ncbi:MAG: peptide-methionine (S)-S-oxide reductase MsrA [Caulobacteraceae bacterium]